MMCFERNVERDNELHCSVKCSGIGSLAQAVIWSIYDQKRPYITQQMFENIFGTKTEPMNADDLVWQTEALKLRDYCKNMIHNHLALTVYSDDLCIENVTVDMQII